jgi:hypothetical protein
VSAGKRKLLDRFGQLDDEQQETLLAFAEFLVTRPALADDADPVEPQGIARPAEETVVMAVRRLTQTYPMLDRRILFNEASGYMAEHALAGRPAAEVIDELEAVFARHYERVRGQGGEK